MAERQISTAGERKRLAGSRKGSAAVREKFDAELTRRRFCELVGIHASTLAKWEQLGLVEPETKLIMNSPTRVFTEAEVGFGSALIELLRANPGRYSLVEAAALARGSGRGTARDTRP